MCSSDKWPMEKQKRIKKLKAKRTRYCNEQQCIQSAMLIAHENH